MAKVHQITIVVMMVKRRMQSLWRGKVAQQQQEGQKHNKRKKDDGKNIKLLCGWKMFYIFSSGSLIKIARIAVAVNCPKGVKHLEIVSMMIIIINTLL